MDDSMIERVARALALEARYDPDESVKDSLRQGVATAPRPITGRHPRWHEYVGSARAAITAMRPRTEDAFLDAGLGGAARTQEA
jgi:hypothetical protein